MGLATLVMISRPDRPPLSHATKLGTALDNLLSAFHMYGRKPQVLLLAALMSAGVHCCFATGVYLIARSLVGPIHSWGMHFVISPLSLRGRHSAAHGSHGGNALRAVPHRAQPGPDRDSRRGLAGGLGLPPVTLLIAALGMGYYFSARRELAEVLHDAEVDDAAAARPRTMPRRPWQLCLCRPRGRRWGPAGP